MGKQHRSQYHLNPRGNALCMAVWFCLASVSVCPIVHAANNDGALIGRSVPGAQLTIRSNDTGFTRTVTADADGRYRFSYLPVGVYTVEASKDGQAIGQATQVTVSLGNATTADLGAGATTLGAVEVKGSRVINAVDVSSTESATNVTREEINRIPVARDISAVATLAPGVINGQYGGISFGGSSVSENVAYINGLNVTDFYKRVGFSSIPFSFFKEFQVKTGGYSVEFGRSTGGVVNAVTQSGTNEFHYGAELNWQPSSLQSSGRNRYNREGERYITSQYDETDRTSLNVFASGPIIPDRLFFYAMYEARDYEPTNTDNAGKVLFEGKSDTGFWGTKIDWQIADNHRLEFLAFSDKDELVTDNYRFDPDTGQRGPKTNTQYSDSGGRNWALTYSGNLTDRLSMKLLYGENKRDRVQNSLNDAECTAVQDRRDEDLPQIGCTAGVLIEQGLDTRKASRADFEWQLGDHFVRFGLDREVNTSDNVSFYPGPDRRFYQIYPTTPGIQLENGGIVPAGVTAYVRARQQEVSGTFETVNSAIYLEDNWSVTPNLILNAGLRKEAFDNKNGEGATYIKIDDMIAPRFGFSWDVNHDGTTKIFGNLGRYFLPIVNQINVKQAGAFLDERTYYVFDGLEPFQYNGNTYYRPILGAQIGEVDNSQGDGTVGDLRGEVDRDIDAVYQDELILGFQSMIDQKWSYGIRGIYRKLHNAIDDFQLTSNGILCDGEPGYIGYIMGNPGKTATVYTDTNCDGESDAFVDIDTSKAGWALYDDDGNYVGERGWVKPKRSYKALEFVLDRAWDERWSFNASYTLSFSKGNAEGPSNSDFGFDNTGRTESFDDPFVNFNGFGYLPNDRRHQFKFRGAYSLSEDWQIGATLDVQSGRPINAFGTGNPFDSTNYHSFYVCVDRCGFIPGQVDENGDPVPYPASQRVYQPRGRGAGGRLPWLFDVGTSLTYQHTFGTADVRARLAVYNLLNQQRRTQVDDEYEIDIGMPNESYLLGTGFQAPRYAQFTLSVGF